MYRFVTRPTPWHVGARNVAPGYHIRLQPLLNGTMHKRRYKFNIVRYLDKKSNNASHQKVSLNVQSRLDLPLKICPVTVALLKILHISTAQPSRTNSSKEQSRIAKSPILLRITPFAITQKNELRTCGHVIRICWRWGVVPFGSFGEGQ